VYRVATYGLGDQQSASTALSYGTQGASAAVSGAFAAGLIPASAIPFIGPAIAGAALLASALIKNSGCGQTCVETSEWANKAGDAIDKNREAYFALPAPRTRSNQQLALQTFDQIWAKLVEICGNPQFGNAGKRCISDRQRGACTWKSKYPPKYPGQPDVGQCFDWFNNGRDPIANDPVIDDPVITPSSVSDSISTAFASEGSTNWLPMVAVAALVFLAVKL